ncbi:2-C-methyl-D-erythritol 4-phosphate cytidylyltransferase [bacterium]|nr:2-C-methyl-D-erythritol 4-phosphate cytidylyltransferase [bacterium]RQV94360.1 MAG: 2-C-methyl-D-erythritol 4-phosphate cytidylyltransferase [bacterium]
MPCSSCDSGDPLQAQYSKVVAIVAAAGSGKRAGKTTPKQFLEISGKPIFIHTLGKFDLCREVDEVLLVVQPDQMKNAEKSIDKYHIQKVKKMVEGGPERQHSVRNGIDKITEGTTIVVIHDAVRPFVSVEKITEVIQMAKKEGAAILAIPVKNTIKSGADGWVKETLKRESLWSVQTPQAFQIDWIKKAYKKADEDNIFATDDALLIERLGYPIKIVQGEEQNLKITSAMDLFMAEKWMNEASR